MHTAASLNAYPLASQPDLSLRKPFTYSPCHLMPVPFQGFGKVIAIRFKRFTKKGRTQHNSTTTGGGDSSYIPADISDPIPTPILSSISSLAHPVSATSEPGLEAAANVSSATSSEGVSLVRKAYDMAQVALPLVQAVASAIPLVGAPMQAAINGLMIGLEAIDRRSQNKSDLDSLTLRLDRLSLNLDNAPPACDPVEQLRRDDFVRMLRDTSARVTTLNERFFASTSVTQAIAGCFTEIDRYLADYLLSSQMQTQNNMQELLVHARRQEENLRELLLTVQSLRICEQSPVGPFASQSTRTVSLTGCLTLVDATGYHHAIQVDYCTSFQQLNAMLQVLLCNCDPITAQIQRRYIEAKEYDFCIDEGTQVTPLTSNKWPSIEVGTKIVMRAIIQQETSAPSEVDYKCCFCGTVNHLGVKCVVYAFQRRAGRSTDCRKCKRRFQITRKIGSVKSIVQPPNSDSNRTTAETLLIRNFHVQRSVRDPATLLAILS
ncbi:hypothetical protein EDB19DRAFT_1031768 [Suillus lakei]|nr:hypothetical protein EDB19DRAFT_1031768 [Suillus lakei]